VIAMKRGILVAAAALALAGCGDDDEATTPVACIADADSYVVALEAAPGDVRLAGTTPIGDCIVDGQSGGDLAQVGEPMVTAATRLNERAREDPAGDATLQLGFLVGAVQEAASTTGGIHEDLVRRLDAAARFNEGGEPLPAAFERAFGEGYAAGQASG
jgi:hypothetical protein